MGKARTKTLVLDAGALIAFERGDARMRALVRETLIQGVRLVIPAGALGQVCAGVRDKRRYARSSKDRLRPCRRSTKFSPKRQAFFAVVRERPM